MGDSEEELLIILDEGEQEEGGGGGGDDDEHHAVWRDDEDDEILVALAEAEEGTCDRALAAAPFGRHAARGGGSADTVGGRRQGACTPDSFGVEDCELIAAVGSKALESGRPCADPAPPQGHAGVGAGPLPPGSPASSMDEDMLAEALAGDIQKGARWDHPPQARPRVKRTSPPIRQASIAPLCPPAVGSEPFDVEEFSGLRVKDRCLDARAIRNLVHMSTFVPAHKLFSKGGAQAVPGEKSWITVFVLARRLPVKQRNPLQSNTQGDQQHGGRWAMWVATSLQGDDEDVTFTMRNTAFDQHWKMAEGSIVAVSNPEVKRHAPRTNGQEEGMAVSEHSPPQRPPKTNLIAKAGAQIVRIGLAADMGWCGRPTAKGHYCRQHVNKAKDLRCKFHRNKRTRPTSTTASPTDTDTPAAPENSSPAKAVRRRRRAPAGLQPAVPASAISSTVARLHEELYAEKRRVRALAADVQVIRDAVSAVLGAGIGHVDGKWLASLKALSSDKRGTPSARVAEPVGPPLPSKSTSLAERTRHDVKSVLPKAGDVANPKARREALLGASCGGGPPAVRTQGANATHTRTKSALAHSLHSARAERGGLSGGQTLEAALPRPRPTPGTDGHRVSGPGHATQTDATRPSRAEVLPVAGQPRE